MKFSIFAFEKILCILHGQDFVMDKRLTKERSQMLFCVNGYMSLDHKWPVSYKHIRHLLSKRRSSLLKCKLLSEMIDFSNQIHIPDENGNKENKWYYYFKSFLFKKYIFYMF